MSPGNTGILTAIFVAARRELQSRTCAPCNGKTFDEYVANIPFLHPQQISDDYQARGSLYHPDRADGVLFNRFFKTNASSIEAVWTSRSTNRNNFGDTIFRAAYLFCKRGHEDEAAELLNIVESKLLSVWRARDVMWKQHDADPKLASLNASNKQVPLAIQQPDPEGNVPLPLFR